MAACLACNAELPAGRRDRKWCSGACRVWAIRHPGDIRAQSRSCRSCGADISHLCYKATTCSKRCNDVARGVVRAVSLPSRDCAVCGSTFTPRAESGKYCSRACRLKRPKTTRSKWRYTDAQRDKDHRRRARKQGAWSGQPMRRSAIAKRDGFRCGLGPHLATVTGWRARAEQCSVGAPQVQHAAG